MMPQIGTVFDEYPYIDSEDHLSPVYYPIVVEGMWWLGGYVRSLDEIGRLCFIPDEELVYLKLKYGG